MTATEMEFDAAAVTDELLDGLTKPRLREVIAHYKLPPLAKAASKDELLAVARAAVRAHAPAGALSAGDEAEALPEPASVSAALEAAPSAVIPNASRWQQIVAMAEYLAKSNLTPEALRGKPHDVGAVLLRANDLGIPLTSALESLYVIKGRVGMEGRLMRALIRRDGHRLRDEPDEEGLSHTVYGLRADTGEDGSASFSLEDAVDQELIEGYERNADGSFRIRGRRDKPQWVRDPRTMLMWRATSRLGRSLFSDCLAGVAYTPDELGFIDAEVGEDPRPAGAPEPTMTVAHQQSEVAQRIANLPDDLRAELREEWKRRNLPKPERLTPAGIRQARALLEPVEAKAAAQEAERTAGVEDAEVVEDAASDESAGGGEKQSEPEGSGEHPLGDADSAHASPASPPPACAGCGELFREGAEPVRQGRDEFHAECAPDLEEGDDGSGYY